MHRRIEATCRQETEEGSLLSAAHQALQVDILPTCMPMTPKFWREDFVSRAGRPSLALNPNSQLFKQPYLNRAIRLQKLEDEVDWWKENFAPAAASLTTRHVGV